MFMRNVESRSTTDSYEQYGIDGAFAFEVSIVYLLLINFQKLWDVLTPRYLTKSINFNPDWFLSICWKNKMQIVH
jgi:hypothetical protein